MLEFTASERRVIIIISIILICSAGFQILKPSTSSDVLIDYHQSDSVFSRRTHQVSLNGEYNFGQHDTLKALNLQENNQTGIVAQQLSLNINTATLDELTQLPRIGPSIARRIIAYRQENGPFRSINELTKVKGIGSKTLGRIKPYLQNPK